MKLLVGLGNPGPKYETTRHNAGWILLDHLADEARAEWGGQKFGGEWARGDLLGESCFFLKPLTFMNLSGRSVAQAVSFFKLSVSDVIVLHDDIDLEGGKVKARAGGGHGGHNGIRSMIAELGSGDFHRLKLGVGRPVHAKHAVSSWVLSPMSDEELLALEQDMLPQVKDRLVQIFKQASSRQ